MTTLNTTITLEAKSDFMQAVLTGIDQVDDFSQYEAQIEGKISRWFMAEYGEEVHICVEIKRGKVGKFDSALNARLEIQTIEKNV